MLAYHSHCISKRFFLVSTLAVWYKTLRFFLGRFEHSARLPQGPSRSGCGDPHAHQKICMAQGIVVLQMNHWQLHGKELAATSSGWWDFRGWRCTSWKISRKLRFNDPLKTSLIKASCKTVKLLLSVILYWVGQVKRCGKFSRNTNVHKAKQHQTTSF